MAGAGAGAECEPCPALHTDHGRQLCPLGPGRGGSGAFARDLDECSLLEEACRGGDCINTDGSFRCSCPEGLSSIHCIYSSPHTIHSPLSFYLIPLRRFPAGLHGAGVRGY